MDRPIEEPVAPADGKGAYESGHLMCRSTPWGIMGFLACSYFAWVSFSHVRRGEYDWPHDAWTAATYIVWILVLVGLVLDTHCFRERTFFGLLVANFVVGLGLTLWSTVSLDQVHNARIGTGALWALAAVVSLSTMGRAKAVGMRGYDSVNSPKG
jgi:hypothetical protein